MNLTCCPNCGAAAFDLHLTPDGLCSTCHVGPDWDRVADDEFWLNLRKPRYVIAVYDCDREMGGMEEGGWSFETGELVDSIAVDTEAVAETIAEALAVEYPYTGQRGMYSKRGPDFTVRIIDREEQAEWEDYLDCRLEPVPSYPIHTPRYE